MLPKYPSFTFAFLPVMHGPVNFDAITLLRKQSPVSCLTENNPSFVLVNFLPFLSHFGEYNAYFHIFLFALINI